MVSVWFQVRYNLDIDSRKAIARSLRSVNSSHLRDESAKERWDVFNITRLFVRELVQVNNKDNIKAPHYWPVVLGFHVILQRLHLQCISHYHGAIMFAMAPQITSISSVCSPVCSGADQRIEQSSTSLAFERGIHRWPVDSLHKGPVRRKCFNLMTSSWISPLLVRRECTLQTESGEWREWSGFTGLWGRWQMGGGHLGGWRGVNILILGGGIYLKKENQQTGSGKGWGGKILEGVASHG